MQDCLDLAQQSASRNKSIYVLGSQSHKAKQA